MTAGQAAVGIVPNEAYPPGLLMEISMNSRGG